MANHYAKDADDFAARLNRLTEEEFVSLIELIRVGEEGITLSAHGVCRSVNRTGNAACRSKRRQNEQYALYEMGTQCQ